MPPLLTYNYVVPGAAEDRPAVDCDIDLTEYGANKGSEDRSIDRFPTEGPVLWSHRFEMWRSVTESLQCLASLQWLEPAHELVVSSPELCQRCARSKWL